YPSKLPLRLASDSLPRSDNTREELAIANTNRLRFAVLFVWVEPAMASGSFDCSQCRSSQDWGGKGGYETHKAMVMAVIIPRTVANSICRHTCICGGGHSRWKNTLGCKQRVMLHCSTTGSTQQGDEMSIERDCDAQQFSFS
ncbi:unnamed protein product, partial [Ectocarpus sp. 12 AP-2014]